MEQPNLENIVRKYTVQANEFIKQIIQYNIVKFREKTRERFIVQDCCSPAVYDYLTSIMVHYIRNKRLDNGHLLSEYQFTIFGGILAILYYYYYMVLIETLSENVLNTKDMERFGMEEYHIFKELYPQLVAGDNLLDASIRQKFLGFSSNILGTSSIAVPTGHPVELGGKKKHGKTRRKHKSKRGKSRRRRRTSV